jgi:hypothetical protein
MRAIADRFVIESYKYTNIPSTAATRRCPASPGRCLASRNGTRAYWKNPQDDWAFFWILTGVSIAGLCRLAGYVPRTACVAEGEPLP